MKQNITSAKKSDSSEDGRLRIGNLFPEWSEHHLTISSSAIEKIKELLLEANQRLDVYALEAEFKAHAQKTNFKPDNVDGAFINFVKNKIKPK